MHQRMFVFLFLVGCSGGGSDKPAVDASTADAFESACGKPGDMGNELGIGKFCATLSDCSNPMAPLCSVLGSKDTHFCTKTCKSTDPAGVCGTSAECTCNANNQCGCTPSACLGN